ncbi:MAG: hypothetical protein IJT79_05940 [Ruminococcus sp.]|nr:hypothetical protein [Ruminococcus sp.]
MKLIYTKPEISVEGLTKQDVLCSSNEISTVERENYTLIDSIWDTLTEIV